MWHSKPRVSIGLPVFNGENYLVEALGSLLAQTFGDFELLISDNASTDGTQEICRRYAACDARIHYSRQPKNLGAAANYNLVYASAAGEYFKWAAHDDVCAPEYLERCVATLDRHPDVIMCYPKTVLIDEWGEVIEYHRDGFDLRMPRPHARFHRSFHSSAWCHAVFGLIRARVLAKSGLIGPYASSDKVLLGELAMLGRCYEIPEYLAFRRLHPEISTRANPTDEAIAAWFDPEASKSKIPPRWRRFVEHLRSIERAQLRWPDRLACYLVLARFYLSPGRVKGIGRDLRQATRIAARLLPGLGKSVPGERPESLIGVQPGDRL
jgi:glycosyltransferase involved in cell wall biosynthesis